VIGTLVPVYPYVFEVSQDITSVEALKGKTIAVRATGDAADLLPLERADRRHAHPDHPPGVQAG
jgi:hypothetical protein